MVDAETIIIGVAQYELYKSGLELVLDERSKRVRITAATDIDGYCLRFSSKRLGLFGIVDRVLPITAFSDQDALRTAVVSACYEARYLMAKRLRTLADGIETTSVRDPRIHVGETFSEVRRSAFGDAGVYCTASASNYDPSTVSAMAILCAGNLGLAYKGAVQTTAKVMPDPDTSRELDRRLLYAYAPVGHEDAAACEMATYICRKYGPGRWWSMGHNPVYVINDDGKTYQDIIDGVPYVRMRSLYYHSPDRGLDAA